MYARGEGGEKYFRSVMWFERAVELGNETAKSNLALLKQNKGVTGKCCNTLVVLRNPAKMLERINCII